MGNIKPDRVGRAAGKDAYAHKALVQKQPGGFVTALPVNYHGKRKVIP